MISGRRWTAPRLALALTIFGVCSSGWCEQPAALPTLPQVAFASFLPAIREGIQKAYTAVVANPQDPSANGKLGMVLHAHGQFEGAEVCYRRARALDPASFRWRYYLGVVQNAQGKYDEAAATLRQALRRDPGYLPTKLKLGECLLATARWEEAEKLYEAILKELPENASAHYGLGRVRAARKNSKGAAESLRKACELFPQYGPAHYAVALAYRDLGKKDQSREELALYQKNPNDVPPSDDRLLAEVNALDENPLDLVRLGTELERVGQLEQSAAAHEKALEINPQLVQAHVNLISIYARLHQFDKAEEHYRAAVRLNPNEAESYYDYGVLLFDQDKYPQAEEAFRKALEINPFHPQARNNLGVMLEREGKLSEAVEQYREAIKNKTDYRLAHSQLGRILVIQENYKEGIEHLLKTISPEDEGTPTYLYALGAAYGRAGDRQNALRYIRMARDQASARGQTQLLVSIDSDLRTLEKENRSQ